MLIIYIVTTVLCIATSSMLIYRYLKINKIYCVAEILLNLIILAVAVIKGSVEINDIFTLICANFLMLLAAYDLKDGLIPATAFVVYAAIGVIACIAENGLDFIYTLIFAAIIFVLLFFACKKSKDGIGMGDVYVIAGTALYAQAAQTMSVIIISMFFGMIYGIILSIKNKTGMKEKIPYIPFLCVGYIIINLIN